MSLPVELSSSRTERDPRQALSVVQKQLSDSDERIRSLIAEHRLLRHKKFREENILCLHKNPTERSDAQQTRIDNLIAAGQNRSTIVSETCRNVNAVVPPNLRKAMFSKEGDSDANQKSRPVKSSLSKVIDDNVALYHHSRKNNTSVNIEQQINSSPRSSRTTNKSISNNNNSKSETQKHYADHDNSHFWLEHDWRNSVEKVQAQKRSAKVMTEEDLEKMAKMKSTPALKIHLERTVPSKDASGRLVKFDRSAKMVPETFSSKNASIELITKHNKMLQELEEEEKRNPEAARDRNKGFFGAPKSQVLHIVHDEMRHLNSTGTSKKRGPPPSQLASSTTLRQFRERTSRRSSEATISTDDDDDDDFDNDNDQQRKIPSRRLATLTLSDLTQVGTCSSTPRDRSQKHNHQRFKSSKNNTMSTVLTGNQIVVDHSKPGPARRYIRSGAYLIADRRRKQWQEADEYFIETSPAREIPKHKLVADKGFGLLKKPAISSLAARGGGNRFDDQKSELSDLTETTPARSVKSQS